MKSKKRTLEKNKKSPTLWGWIKIFIYADQNKREEMLRFARQLSKTK